MLCNRLVFLLNSQIQYAINSESLIGQLIGPLIGQLIGPLFGPLIVSLIGHAIGQLIGQFLLGTKFPTLFGPKGELGGAPTLLR